jgi:chemotaxis protein methyltransferase CheR
MNIGITDEEFYKIMNYVKNHCGIDLNGKKHLVEGRLQNLLISLNLNSFSDYYKYIIQDKTGEAVTTLLSKITTNHTYFLREIDHFNFFRDKVLPYLASTVTTKDLRIWSAGCSSGEEPYTLAMIIADFFGQSKWLWDSRVLATDISRKALDTAVAGVYTTEQVTTLPDSWRRNYLEKISNNEYRIVDKIRSEVIFRSFNLNNPTFPFKRKFHVIFCRNVMIYFDHNTKRELINKFYEYTEPGGYLFIGHAESINREETTYQYVMPAVYRKG